MPRQEESFDPVRRIAYNQVDEFLRYHRRGEESPTCLIQKLQEICDVELEGAAELAALDELDAVAIDDTYHQLIATLRTRGMSEPEAWQHIVDRFTDFKLHRLDQEPSAFFNDLAAKGPPPRRIRRVQHEPSIEDEMKSPSQPSDYASILQAVFQIVANELDVPLASVAPGKRIVEDLGATMWDMHRLIQVIAAKWGVDLERDRERLIGALELQNIAVGDIYTELCAAIDQQREAT